MANQYQSPLFYFLFLKHSGCFFLCALGKDDTLSADLQTPPYGWDRGHGEETSRDTSRVTQGRQPAQRSEKSKNEKKTKSQHAGSADLVDT